MAFSMSLRQCFLSHEQLIEREMRVLEDIINTLRQLRQAKSII